MITWLFRALALIAVLGTAVLLRFGWVTRDRHPGTVLNLHLESAVGDLSAGFAAVDMTPPVPDTWTDADGNARYEPGKGDTFTDGNGNGKFDPVWMAGFQHQRPAMGVHDPLWARTMILSNGQLTVALSVIDAIGLGADDILTVRKNIPKELGIDYLAVMSTHSHETPDLVGLWGKTPFRSGVDPRYLKQVQEAIRQSLEQARGRMRPALLRVGQDPKGATHLVEDSREPFVLDPGITILQALDAEADTTLGVFFNWANHPETTWNRNLLLSSDFPHFLREALEKGVKRGDTTLLPGLGGTALFAIGAIGGLMTTSPGFPIPGYREDTVYTEPGFAKAQAQGQHLAALGMAALEIGNANLTEQRRATLKIKAHTLELPLANPLYRLAAFLGVVKRGTSSWINIRSEIAFWQLGDWNFLHYPGELYPEILNGGVEAPQGQDFPIRPVETPPLRSLFTPGPLFTMGLSNDMIGYIVPKSQWDVKAPYTYSFKEAPYGEINSLGPETAPILYRALRDLIRP